ncbi:helicase-related protein [Amycolatopsis sp. BJA-103]|uniref:helicase-related protein n=1 Tax=Amycolatopsis sp. BJA-103 TaxID=1911175 RepID=UPI000C7935D0|nr:helicase-related protein [Amycolatopsis sp. BJA-103]AUI61743.1 helicase [Amycolatopsis sp. BJA-103]PNE20962.1 helicase [Amycolatopsis sp. BJA-103]
MNGSNTQSPEQACQAFVGWLDRRVVAAGRGDGLERLEVAPAGTFWLGRLACEEEVQKAAGDERSERLDPCAIGIRLRPASPPSWSMSVIVRARGWVKDSKDGPDPDKRWWRTGLVEEKVPVSVGGNGGSFGSAQLAAAFAAVGAPGLTAEIRVEVEDWHQRTELVVQLVNTSPQKGLTDSHLYETEIEISGLATAPFQLESLPDSFRYDRKVPAYGVNVGVDEVAPGVFRSTDTVSVQTHRPDYWDHTYPKPDLKFSALAHDPLPQLTKLVDALTLYDDAHWSPAALDVRQEAESWTDAMRAEADASAQAVFAELDRLRKGLALLESTPALLQAFQLMNEAIGDSTRGKYPDWRPFQIGFLLSSVRFLAEPTEEANYVDTVWFATGGGKTETYLGLLLTAAFYDRLTGKIVGVTAWSRFPLRLLSLQQTQRFADALASAEIVRQAHKVGGAPFSLGFLVGQAGTPNKIVPTATAKDDETTPDSPGVPNKYQVLLRCPFCRDENLEMRFNRQRWMLEHCCKNESCRYANCALPVYVVDQEVYRFLPTVVVGTLDKAASISLQQAMRGLVGPPRGSCSEAWHGFTYADRARTPNGCLVPNCQGSLTGLPMDKARFAPTLRLQDELHLLRDSLGAVDAHYESLLDHLQHETSGSRAKIVASSATLTGYERQVDVLYQREGRVFPQPGPRAGESFWTVPTAQPLRQFVAVAPRGVTLEHVSDRTLDTLQRCIRELIDDQVGVCAEAGVEPKHADMLVSQYGTNVVYGSTLYDVEAAGRSLGSNNTVEGINVEQLTGQTEFDEVRAILERLEKPEKDFTDRVHVVAASSMLSHGVDVERLNTMVMLGLPLTTAEFIQTTARVGRSRPGLVYVLHKIGRERDAQTFRHFGPYVRQGDRFVDPIPITRRSRRVLDLTIAGAVAARTLMIREPASKQRLSTPLKLRDYLRTIGLTPQEEADAIAAVFGLDGPEDSLHKQQILSWLKDWFADLEDPTLKTNFMSDIGPTPPMMSLRDVEATAPIHD